MKNLEVNKTVKFALLIEYDGNNLVGWQKQNEGISVQSSLEEAAKKRDKIFYILTCIFASILGIGGSIGMIYLANWLGDGNL